MKACSIFKEEEMKEDKRSMAHVLRRSESRGSAAGAGEEKRVDSVDDDHKQEIDVKIIGEKNIYNENKYSDKQKHLNCIKQDLVVTNIKGSSLRPDTRASSSYKKEQDDLETARAEMSEVRQENQRLKMYLDRIMKDYETLEKQFVNIVQQEAKKSTEELLCNDHDREIEEPELVSLSLGRFSSSVSKKDETIKNKASYCLGISNNNNKEEEQVDEGLSLALDCKYEASKLSDDANENLTNNPSPANSIEEAKEEEAEEERWPPNEVVNNNKKTMRSSGDDEILHQSQVKKARVSVRARCDTPTMNDGCQWRKYGQKIAKGNPCPRAYYRCTVAPSCPVRKQVQRCADDMSILITTYEGTHNHPLPVSATGMASTTSAAASMLLSGSSSSSSSSRPHNNNLHGLNFYFSDNSIKSKQFYAPNSSSTSPLHSTITIDLTTKPAPTSSSSLSHFSRFISNYPQVPTYSSTNLNFSSSESSSMMSWGNGLLTNQPYIKNNQIGTLNLGRQPMENIYQSYMQNNNPNPNPNLLLQSLPADAIAAATKAITTDPSFHTVLAAALKSIIGNGTGNGSGIITGGANQVSGDGVVGQKLKWGQQFPVASSYSETVKVSSGCASTYLNKSSSTSSHQQQGSLIFMPPNSLPFSTSKSATASPADHEREHAD